MQPINGLDSKLFSSSQLNVCGKLANIPNSPLKRKRSVEFTSSNLTAENTFKAKRFRENGHQIVQGTNIKFVLITNRDIKTQKIISNLTGKIKIQVSIITSSYSFLRHPQETQKGMERYIAEVAVNDEFTKEEKLAELGILYYYLVSNKNIPLCLNFMSERISEIESELKSLRKIHLLHCPIEYQSILPSGCNSYLFRAFARMIFTPDGSFNPGGCHAVIKMASSRLAKFFGEEERVQIIKVVTHLLNDEKFCSYFWEPFEVIEDLKESILIDMKLPKDSPFCFSYVQWSLLKVFFNPLGQTNEPSCFTYSLLLNLINNEKNSEFVVKTLVGILKTGKFLFENKEIPILPLLNTRMTAYEEKFKLNLPIKNFSNMTAFDVTKECSIFHKDVTEKNSDGKNLDEIMELEFDSEKDYAKKIFFSLDKVYMQQILFAMLQFMAENSMDTNSAKCDLITALDALFTEMGFNKLENSRELEFYTKMREVFFKNLFITYYMNNEIKIRNDRVIFENHKQGFIFKQKDREEYKKFKHENRLHFLDQNSNYHSIDGISEFQQILQQSVSSIISEDNFDEVDIINFSKFIKSDAFKLKLAEKIFQYNKSETALTTDDYLYSDSFFLLHNGGNNNFLCYYEPLKNNFNQLITFEPENVEDFFDKLLSKFHIDIAPAKDFFENKSSWILMQNRTHSFNFCPLLIKKYLAIGGMLKFDKNLFRRAKKIELLTESSVASILLKTLPWDERALIYEKVRHIRSIPEFLEEVKKLIRPELHDIIDVNIDKCLNMIKLKKLGKNLPNLIIKITKSQQIEKFLNPLNNKIKKYTNGSDKTQISPINLARIFFKTFIKFNSIKYKSEYDIERKICSFFSIPEVIKIANLNWMENDYQYLCIKYDFIQKELIFVHRINNRDIPVGEYFSADILKEISLIYANQAK